MGLKNYLRWKAIHWALPKPFESRHHDYSTISCYEEQRPSQRLLDIAFAAIPAAPKVDLRWLSARMGNVLHLPDIWPGEHYKLLASLVATIKPKRIVEVGTYAGLSALAMKASMPAESEL